MEKQEFDARTRHEGRDVVVEETVNVFEVPVMPRGRCAVLAAAVRAGEGEEKRDGWERRGCDGHCARGPLYFLDNVETAVDDELIHVARLFAEARHAIAALLGGAKFVFEEGGVFCADDGEVVGHLMSPCRPSTKSGRMMRWVLPADVVVGLREGRA